MNKANNLCALIPAYNPGAVVAEVVAKTLQQVDKVILVDDGCNRENRQILEQIVATHGSKVELLTHLMNLGKGFAIHSGLQYAVKHDWAYVVMLDSDGQHNPQEIALFKQKLAEAPCEFIMGVRTAIKKMPFRSQLGNVSMSLAFRLFAGQKLIDTQSGFRLLSHSFAASFLQQCPPGRYETEMKMLYLAAKKFNRIVQVEISTTYIDDNKNSKFRPVQDSIRVFSSFLLFTGVGFLSFLLDYVIYLLVLLFGNYFLTAHLLSRLCSGIFNFWANKRFVFKNEDALVLTGTKYVLAAVLSLLLSTSVLYFLVDYLSVSEMLAKPMAELLTFCLNFLVLRYFVFYRSC